MFQMYMSHKINLSLSQKGEQTGKLRLKVMKKKKRLMKSQQKKVCFNKEIFLAKTLEKNGEC